ncbi:MAG: class II aldolase/adducin family protein [Xanthobacteraceae bacterium]
MDRRGILRSFAAAGIGAGLAAARGPASAGSEDEELKEGKMSHLDDLLRDLVVANRILSNENVVDAYGHISVRHPDNPKRFFMSRSRAPELVERHDLIEFDAGGEPVSDKRKPYLERYIHAAIYEARPDVMSVVHAHAEDTLPFGVIDEPLEPVIHSGSFIGGKVPVWDIRKKFGDTNMLVTNLAQGGDLAKCLGRGHVALMRGHGFAAAAASIIEVVRLSVYLPRNARVQMNALHMGGRPKPLSKGEIAARFRGYQPTSAETWRAWEYWAHRAGCADMIGEPHGHDGKS